MVWENESGVGRRGKLADGVAEFCGHLATLSCSSNRSTRNRKASSNAPTRHNTVDLREIAAEFGRAYDGNGSYALVTVLYDSAVHRFWSAAARRAPNATAMATGPLR